MVLPPSPKFLHHVPHSQPNLLPFCSLQQLFPLSERPKENTVKSPAALRPFFPAPIRLKNLPQSNRCINHKSSPHPARLPLTVLPIPGVRETLEKCDV